MEAVHASEAVWKNSEYKYAGNDIIRKFVGKANAAGRKEIEELIAGGSIRKTIRQELTYRDLYSDFDNLWSILFTTGYLTQRSVQEDGLTELVIPNREICWIYVEQIQEWFKEETRRDSGRLEAFCRAFQENHVLAIEEGFNEYLRKTISIRDTSVKRSMKENFYHGILLGIFGYMDDWVVMSNAEDAAFDEGCREAIRQIRDRGCEEILVRDAYMVCQAAELYACTGKPGTALEKLEETARSACTFDEKPVTVQPRTLLALLFLF